MNNMTSKNPKWIAATARGGTAVCELQSDGSYKARSTVVNVEFAITMVQALNDREDFLVTTSETNPIQL